MKFEILSLKFELTKLELTKLELTKLDLNDVSFNIPVTERKLWAGIFFVQNMSAVNMGLRLQYQAHQAHQAHQHAQNIH